MQDRTISTPFTAHHLNDVFKKTVVDYGIMMLGVDAKIIGECQAELAFDSIGESRSRSREQILREYEDNIMQPPNSCGDQSNLICSLFLSPEQLEVFTQTDYEVLSPNGHNLLDSIDSDHDSLFRFEVDHALNPVAVTRHKNISSLLELEALLFKGINFRNKLVLLDGQLAYINMQNQASTLAVSEEGQEELSLYFAKLDMEEIYIFGLDDPFLNQLTDEPSLEEIRIFNLIKAVKTMIHGMDFGWRSSHSFTALIPKHHDLENQTLYPYQSYFGRHTLSQWVSSDKYTELSSNTVTQYVKKLTLLANSQSRAETKQNEVALFSLGGSDERRLLTNPLVIGPTAVRVKFKSIIIKPELSLSQINMLKNFFNTYYPGESPSDQVENYQQKAKMSMTGKLEKLIELVPSKTSVDTRFNL